MLQRFLIIALTLCSLTASAQWQQTGSRVRYVNGLGIPTKDTAAGVAADSSQILIRPADSSLYVKYKRTWLRVGGGGGSIAGSGTTNYIPKFTSSTAIGNSQIFDNGTNVGIGTASPWDALSIPFNSKLSFGSSTYPLSISRSSAGNLITTISDNYDVNNTRIDFVMRNGSVNQITPLSLLSNGNVGIGTTSPEFKLDVRSAATGTAASFGIAGLTINPRLRIDADEANNTVTLNPNYNGATSPAIVFKTQEIERMRITSAGNVGIGTASPSEKLHLVGNTFRQNDASNSFGYTISTTSATTTLATLFGGSSFGIRTGGSGSDNMRITSGGNALIGTNTDNGVDKLQVSGSVNVSTLATTNNLSVTTNATVGGTLRVTGSTTLGTTTTGAITASSIDAASGNATFGNIYSNGIVQMLGVNVKYRNISATYTATTSDDYFINITSGTFTLNLPTAATPFGQVYVIKNSGTGTVTVDPNGTQTIDGATTFAINVQNQSITIIGDGSNWKIVSKYL